VGGGAANFTPILIAPEVFHVDTKISNEDFISIRIIRVRYTFIYFFAKHSTLRRFHLNFGFRAHPSGPTCCQLRSDFDSSGPIVVTRNKFSIKLGIRMHSRVFVPGPVLCWSINIIFLREASKKIHVNSWSAADFGAQEMSPAKK
jgi:hypothetical protein